MGKKTKIKPGDKFNRWTLIEFKRDEHGNKLGWLCRCDCDNKTIKLIFNISTIVSGKSTSCGCFRSQNLSVNNPMFNDVTAEKVSVAVALAQTPENISRRVQAAQSLEAKAKRKDTNISRYGGVAPSCFPEIKAKIAATNVNRYGGSTPASDKNIIRKMSNTYLNKTGFDNPAKDPDVLDKIRKTNLDRYGKESTLSLPEVRAAGIETMKTKYGITENITNAMQIPAIRKKAFTKKGKTKPEKKLEEFLIQNSIVYEYEAECGDSRKLWDFVLYKDGVPALIIEIDGEYVHGFLDDPNGAKSGGINDHLRFLKVPENVKYVQVDSGKIKSLFPEISKLINIDYEQFISDMVERCKNEPFPYPAYDNKKLQRSFKSLCLFDKVPKKGMWQGSNLINHFHRSIWSSNKEDCVSPIKGWSNKVILEKTIRNRTIYSGIPGLSSMDIIRGFSVSRIAPRVSIFQPTIAKFILSEYSADALTIVDPFSGFSGRMLATLSLNKHYTGYDIRQEAISESLDIVNFLNMRDQVDLNSL